MEFDYSVFQIIIYNDLIQCIHSEVIFIKQKKMHNHLNFYEVYFLSNKETELFKFLHFYFLSCGWS